MSAFQSDMYSVGVLALELFQPFGTEMERVHTLGNLREGTLPDAFCRRWPILAKFIAQLTSRDPGVRPNASQLLQSELFISKDVVRMNEVGRGFAMNASDFWNL